MIDTKKDSAVFIIGNGFNYYIKEYLDNNELEEERKEKMKSAYSDRIKSMWENHLSRALGEYCDLMKPITSENSNTNGEFFLKDLDEFCNRINASEKNIMDSIEDMIADNIKKNMSIDGSSNPPLTVDSIFMIKNGDNEEYEKFYTCLQEIFSKVKIKNLHMYTTNYDELADVVLREQRNGSDVEHLHGHYNDSRSIICCSPDKKKDKVGQKISGLKEKVESARVVVLFGLGLESDPHIREILNSVENVHFIIIDANPTKYFLDRIVKEDEYKFFKGNYMYFINTAEYMIDENVLKEPACFPELLIKRLEVKIEEIRDEMKKCKSV